MVQAKMNVNRNNKRPRKSQLEMEKMVGRYNDECGPVTVYKVQDSPKTEKELA